MKTTEKINLMQTICRLDFDTTDDGDVALSAVGLEDGSERGFLQGFLAFGDTKEDAVGALFEEMTSSTRLVKNATRKDRKHYIWHAPSKAFVEC